ncbi:FAD-dependent thymidylate synthase [bacterium]|nr:FAD-dependent thymidylate synthase [bacterium]
MNNIKVELLDYTSVDTVLNAIGKPYKNERPTLDLLKRIVDSGHESVIEHAFFNFNIDGISRLCLQELARHRIASFTVESTRYTLHKMLKEFEPYMKDDGNIKYLSVDIDENKVEIISLVNKYFVNPYEITNTAYIADIVLQDLYYSNMFSQITCLYNSYEYLKEMTRIKHIEERAEDYLKYSLLESKRTSLAFSINLRSFRNFLKLRNSKSAHFEIRKLAKMMKDEIMKTNYRFLVEDL